MKFSSRTDWTTTPNDLSKTLEAFQHEGKDILDLTVSNPTRCGFQYLNKDLLQALTHPDNLKYEPDPHGLIEARETVCRYYAGKNIFINPEQIFLTANTSEAYSFVFRLLFEPGESLLAPQPSYPLLDYLAGIHDVKLERYPLLYKDGWEMDLRGFYTLFEPEPRAFLFVNPNNPTGNYAHQEELTEISFFCKKREMAIISDEVFLDYPLDLSKPPASCAAELPAPAFTLSGISKILGLPQMKLSWLVVSGPEKIRKDALSRLEIISDTYLSASTPSQRALALWLSEAPKIQDEILTRIQTNYSVLKETFAFDKQVRLCATEGGWHTVFQLPSNKMDDEWAQLFLKEDQVLVHPGYLFDFRSGNFMAVSLLPDEAIFKEGLKRIAKRVKLSL